MKHYDAFECSKTNEESMPNDYFSSIDFAICKINGYAIKNPAIVFAASVIPGYQLCHNPETRQKYLECAFAEYLRDIMSDIQKYHSVEEDMCQIEFSAILQNNNVL